MKNNSNQNKSKKASNEPSNDFNLKFYMYHFPNGQNALVLPLNGSCVDIEIEHVYPPKGFNSDELVEVQDPDQDQDQD